MPGKHTHELSLRIVQAPDAALFVVQGDFGGPEAGRLLEQVRQGLGDTDRVEIDICAATLLDSTATDGLVVLHRELHARGVRMEIVIGSPYQEIVFDVAGLTDVLGVRHRV